MDGFWVVTMSFTLALAKPAKNLSEARPPSSLLGWYTMTSVLGLIAIDFLFTVIGLAALNAQDWYQCRKWDPDSAVISSIFLIGDNYETSVIFLITGAQYLSSAMAFNFGHKHRQPWLYNIPLMAFLVVFFFIHIFIIFVPSELSCFFRVNCTNEDSLRGALDSCAAPISNEYNSTVMPADFRVTMFLLIVANTIAVMLWEFVVVLGPVGKFFRAMFPQVKPLKL
jgi:cation-transporting ATPase 13A3/4/5